MNYGSITVAIR